MLTSATRLIDRMDEPSQSMERIWTRLARGSLFMPLLSDRSCFTSSIIDHFRMVIFALGGPRWSMAYRLRNSLSWM